eukprot:TRINITY_DN4735_c0_g4_i1.p1 TRINITY_DN4735_c0_g4~~TRINITY_DN4735_c0_g4_i1.p1  ORF type:complete len:831 (-),score=291.76 TRINITY_DN4735_c0_g4_i1:171-2663(-)
MSKKRGKWREVDVAPELLMGFAGGGFLQLEELDGAEVINADNFPPPTKSKKRKATDNTQNQPNKRAKQSEEVKPPQQVEGTKTDKNPKKKRNKNKRNKQQGTPEKTDDSTKETESNAGDADETNNGEKSENMADNAEENNPDDDGAANSENVDKMDVTETNSEVTTSTPPKKKKARNNKKNKKKQQQKSATEQNPQGESTETTKSESDSKQTNTKEEEPDVDTSAWSSMNLHPLIMKGLKFLKFSTPTLIQQQSIPPAINFQKDIVGAAETGSGKTLAFGIPIVQQLLVEREKSQQQQQKQEGGENLQENTDENNEESVLNEKKLPALIISPTRELAMQIVNHLKALAKFTPIKIAPIVGGISIQKQERLISLKPDIVVATPGRFWDMCQNYPYLCDLTFLKYLVIDEADRMIERGHFKELKNILTEIQRTYDDEDAKFFGEETENQDTKKDNKKQFKRQTFIFSATLTMTDEGRVFKKSFKRKQNEDEEDEEKTLKRLLEIIKFERKVENVNLSNKNMINEKIRESKIECLLEEKDHYLYYFLLKYPGKTLVFVNTISAIKRLVPILSLLHIQSWGIHANMEQRQRLKNLDRFKNSKTSVLVSSDVLARGVDIPLVDHVIHYHVPSTVESYVHRSGRTARAQNTGLSVMLVSPPEHKAFKRILFVLNKNEDGADIDNFPVDMRYFPQITKRVKAAVNLEKEMKVQKRSSQTTNWYVKAAEELDIDLDDEIKNETEGENEKERKASQKIATIKQELEQLLSVPLKPQGSSSKYYSRDRFVTLDSEEAVGDALQDLSQKKKKKNKNSKQKTQPPTTKEEGAQEKEEEEQQQ